jgi:bifunctional DNA-binding transcriptional regulator/antitoxin component of YhaV-PrlF toxin-antitoxin module
MKEVETVIKVKPGFKTHIPKTILEAAGVGEGDFIKIKVSKVED